MLKSTVSIINHLGLHARAAAQLVKLAGQFESRIFLISEDQSISANAKSILSVLTLAASKGTTLLLEVEGDDERIAHEAVLDLFSSGFGESL